MKKNFVISIETLHVADMGTTENVSFRASLLWRLNFFYYFFSSLWNISDLSYTFSHVNALTENS